MSNADSWAITFKGGETFSAPTAKQLCDALNAADTFGSNTTIEHMICLANRAQDFSGNHVSVATYEIFLRDLHASGFATLTTNTDNQ